MNKTLKMYFAAFALVVVLGAFSYMNQRTNAPMPTATTPEAGDSCSTAPGGG